MQPALESEAAFLDVKGEVGDVERAGCYHLNRLVVLYESLIAYIHIGNVRRLSNINTVRIN